ncbi:MAG: prolyl aminopeptidase [bacterium]|nr:prolyl aminopeptidase [bacterium]
MKKTVKPTYPAYKSDFLDVGHGHHLYYELYGNPKGKPVLYLHGGPGAGFRERHKGFFDPKIWNVILFDQRGAGRSTPFASLHENTTASLVKDINLLLDKLGLEKVLLFGGSWGSTLALVYAIENPKRVVGIITWGVFLCDRFDQKYYLEGGSADFAPEAWERFASIVPKEHQSKPAPYYYRQMQGKNEKAKDMFAFEWTLYEWRLMDPDASLEKLTREIKKEGFYKSLAPLEAHYILAGGFFPEGYILKNAPKLKIPVTIVQGRYDYCCPPVSAYRLHKKIRGSKLIMVNAGHASSERPTTKKLIETLKDF